MYRLYQNILILNQNESCWIIDPIDGSSNKMSGFPYSTTIAWKDKELGIIFGAIYDYEKDEIYYASKGEGSFKLDREGNKIKVEMPKSVRHITYNIWYSL